MLDLVIIDGMARGVIARNLVTGEIRTLRGRCGGPRHRRVRQRLLPLDQRQELQRHGHLAGHKRGAFFANPCYTQIHPTCIPVSGEHQSKLTLMSESLRNDGRVWVPKQKGDTRPPEQIPEDERDYYLERKYPSFGNLVPRDVASRNAKAGVRRRPRRGRQRAGRLSRFRRRHQTAGTRNDPEKYGNLFHMYEKITGEDAVQGADAHLSRRPLHDGRLVGRLQPDEHRARACSCSARRISPTTARTASVPAR